ncbi:MAG: DUF3160 domain-containing protein [Tissierellia bacterium]|jgi:hypothetical protein|nr:DUF3160 domain-containing protein [Tissierellia bacterium]
MNIKKFLVLLLCMVLFTSCSDNSMLEEPEEPIEEKPETGDEKSVPAAWNMNMEEFHTDVPFSIPVFTPAVEKYDVDEDLSNLVNAGQYTGFTDEQIKSIYQDGFVVLKPSYEYLKMHHIYEYPMYKESPVFITVDSALHLYHIYYGNSLKLLEVSSLYDKLQALTKNMLTESLNTYDNSEHTEIKEELKFAAAYFLTGAKLIDADLEGVEIPEEIAALADDEIRLIEDAFDFASSPILGKDLDYSQFTVRGHYTGNEKLSQYFKTMMWYGLSGFPVFDESKDEPVLDMDSLTKSMIITCLLLKNEDSFVDFENIYTATALYTGMSDDLGIFEIRDLITKVYGQNPDLNLFKDTSYYDKLIEEALLLPEPKIQPKYTSVTASAGRQFRFMGQRYSFDAEVMQNLIEPFIRPVPSGLDVVASFGSLRAEELLDTYYKPKEEWSMYEEQLNKMREKQREITDNEWKSDLYKGWLWSIKSSALSFEDTEGMPFFMRNQKWTDKNIHTALGSYAELKHDSILYMKQSGAEMGGGPEPVIPYNYVEPNVEVYAKLKWLAENTKAQLEARNMLKDEIGLVLDQIIDIQDTLMNVSVKELTNQTVSEEENLNLYRYGGMLDSIIQIMQMNLMRHGVDTSNDFTTALIADVSTIAPNNLFPKGTYLEIGNGLPCEIYVVCQTNGNTYLAKGALFNYYEFLSDKRLTNHEWQTMVGVKRAAMVYDQEKNIHVPMDVYDKDGKRLIDEDEYDFENIIITGPSENMVPKPAWTESFISPEENRVTINHIKVNWE